jgi:type II secretory pathway pseudopilin PulG
MTRQRGFTLMEMLVGVSTMMVLGLIATPAATTYFQRYQLTAATEQLAFEIHRARMQAVGQNRFVRIRVSAGEYVREESTNGITYVASDAPVDLPPGLDISAGDAGGPRFNRNGLATGTTYITISRGDDQKVVRTNLVGRVTIE